MSSGTFFYLEHCILITLNEVAENFCTTIFEGGLESSGFIQNSCYEI